MRSLSRPVSSFSPPVVDYVSSRQAEREENAEIVDDMSPQGAEGDALKLYKAGYESKATSLVNFGQNRRSFAGAWKPVIDGKIQLPDESPSAANWTSEPVRSSGAMQASASASYKQGAEKPSVSNFSGSSDVKKDDEGNDSDSEIRRVPELPEKSKSSRPQKSGGGSGSSSRKRAGASSTDKEGKRLKRLLRNRVSAQQARERKKAYLVELEHKAKDLEARNAELEEKNATLQRENYMLRQIVKNTTMRGGDLASS